MYQRNVLSKIMPKGKEMGKTTHRCKRTGGWFLLFAGKGLSLVHFVV